MFIEIISIRLVSLKELWEHFLGRHNFGLVRQRWNRPHRPEDIGTKPVVNRCQSIYSDRLIFQDPLPLFFSF